MKKIFKKLIFGLEIVLYGSVPIVGVGLMIYFCYNDTTSPILTVIIRYGGIIVLAGMAIVFFVLFLQAVRSKGKTMEDLVGKEITLYARKSAPGVLYHKEELSEGSLFGDIFAFFLLAVTCATFLIQFINMYKE